MILETLIFGGGAYAGGKAVNFWGKPGLLSHWRKQSRPAHPLAQVQPQVIADTTVVQAEPDLGRVSRNLAIALASLKLASAGALLNVPAISMASMPFMLYVFIPVFKNAGQKLRVERRINDQVLVATRVTVCTVMGYTFIAALDATLYAGSQWVWARNEQIFRKTLQAELEKYPDMPAEAFPVLREPYVADHFQQAGERRGERTAPWMLGAFVLTLPLVGVERAAAFLTTMFGAHLRHLGPYTTRRLMMQAVEQGVLVLRADALGRVTQVDTLVLDGKLLENSAVKSQADTMLLSLKHRYGEDVVYVLPERDDDLLERLHTAGKKICFVRHANTEPAMQAAYLNIVCQMPMGSHTEGTDIVLLGEAWEQLGLTLALADTLRTRQGFNLNAPNNCDVVDIGTTVFLNFGLVYSVLFTYTGILLGVLNNHPQRSEKPSQQLKSLANRLG
ncbi:hypothetical protein [Thiothrix lacustris]|uniref:hypothetical protein n=1 Tax=Thiothrix lacustris TaxID=525917 RepID=UPI0027E5BB80|nr:hypothetical protein [Thiothrix lacustris]WMP19438.1 hypothetical protein RCS87_19300 [Thiothrix lacustris]